MTLNEAITHSDEIANSDCSECAKQHKQLAEWLKELKSKRECEEKMKVGNNIVNHPPHYTSGEIECIDALKASMPHAEFCGFLKGNAMKYLWRYDKKGKATEDLEKSRWYLDRLWAETKSEV